MVALDAVERVWLGCAVRLEEVFGLLLVLFEVGAGG